MALPLNQNRDISHEIVQRFWPLALLFFAVYIPISFFILNDKFGGWFQVADLMILIIAIGIYYRSKNIFIASNTLASLGILILIPWLITGGPAGAGLWWSLVYAVWIFFLTKEKQAIFWLSLFTFLCITIVVLSLKGLISIAYPLFELLNLLFAFIFISVLVHYSAKVLEYYLKLSSDRANELVKNIIILEEIKVDLRNSIERNKIFIQQAPHAIAMFNTEMCYIATSQKWIEDYGLTGKELIGYSHYQVFPEIGDDWKAIHKDCLNGAINKCDEARFERSDGCEQWITWDVRPWYIEKDKIGGLIMSTADITERKKLEKSNSQLASIVEYSTDAVISKTFEGLIISWNKGAERIFGYTYEEATGKSTAILTPEEIEEEQKAIIEKLKNGELVDHYESVRISKDKIRIDVSITLSLMKDKANNIIGVSEIIRDITKQKNADRKFKSLLESAPDSMVIVNQIGNIELVNSQTEKLFGYDRKELLGKPIDIILQTMPEASLSNNVVEYFINLNDKAEDQRFELVGKRNNNPAFSVELSVSPIEAEYGTWVSASIRDVTERKKFEQTLQEANRMKSEFLSTMSHELRTPLNGVIGFSEFLLGKKMGPLNAKQEEYLGYILSSGTNLLRLINDVLDLSRVESGKLQLLVENFSIKNIIEEVVTNLSLSAERKNIKITTTISPDVNEVNLDRHKCYQILYNVLSNAIKFTDEGEVSVVAEMMDAEWLSIKIKDTGIGISQEGMQRLFKPFVQLDASTSRKQDGTGLGLVLTKKLVELQSGRISIQSDAGIGSLITMMFPKELPKLNKVTHYNS